MTTKTPTILERRESEVRIKEDTNCHNSVEVMNFEVQNDRIEAQIGVENQVLIVDNKVITASELMSELSIKEDQKDLDNKSNDS